MIYDISPAYTLLGVSLVKTLVALIGTVWLSELAVSY